MSNLINVKNLNSLDDESLSDFLEAIISDGLNQFDDTTIRKVLQESFRRTDPDVVWNALEIIALRQDLNVTDLLTDAAKKQQEWSVAIFLIEQLLERSDDIDSNVFLYFLTPENGEQARWMAARALLILGSVSNLEKIQTIFNREKDILVKLNLAAQLFIILRDQKYFSFVQEYSNDLNLEIAKEARECKKLVQEHLS